eukprot:scaffold54853_cov58-Phaeocystis_antarctica.AAC.3
MGRRTRRNQIDELPHCQFPPSAPLAGSTRIDLHPSCKNPGEDRGTSRRSSAGLCQVDPKRIRTVGLLRCQSAPSAPPVLPTGIGRSYSRSKPRTCRNTARRSSADRPSATPAVQQLPMPTEREWLGHLPPTPGPAGRAATSL